MKALQRQRHGAEQSVLRRRRVDRVCRVGRATRREVRQDEVALLAERGQASAAVTTGEGLTQRVHHDLVRRGTVAPRAPGQDHDAGRVRAPAELGEHAGAAHAGGALDADEHRPDAPNPSEVTVERGKIAVTPGERRRT